MLKQWKNENLGVIYFYVPNSKNNEVLTSDGVLIPYDEFKSMTSEAYASKKNTNGGYDYALSKKSERLVKKALVSNPQMSDNQIDKKEDIVKTETKPKMMKKIKVTKPTEPQKVITDSNPSIEEMMKGLANEKKLPKKVVAEKKEEPKSEVKHMQLKIVEDEPKEVIKPIETTITEVPKSIENTVTEVPKEKEVKVETPIVKTKKEFNWFDFAYPKLILVVVIICSCLSISFTKTYMLRLQSLPIAYAMSSAILIYGIIGMQMARRSWRAKKYLQAFIFGITSISVLGFSMFSAVDVNYAKFKESHQVIEETYNTNDGKKLSYDLLKEELTDNKVQIEKLNKDIEFQQTQWVLAWDSELKKNVLLEGRISSTAQEKITDDNNRIEELNKRNREINEKLREYAESGISVEKTESETERAKSLTDLIGALLNVSGNIIQLIILLIPSIFTDLINILGTTIYVQRFEEKEEKQ